MVDLSHSDIPRRTYAVEAGGAATESMGGVAVVVLAILALAGVMRGVLTDISGIVFGAAFIVEGAALAARHTAIMERVGEGRMEQLEMGGGMSVELVAGVAAIALGILSLIGLVPTILMPALVITGGAALILSAGAVERLNDIRADAFSVGPTARAVARGAVSSAAAGQVLAGLGAVALGILALVGVGDPAILTIVGMLVLGAAITLSGTALSGKMLSLFRRG
jgi:hypothetical protein